MDPKAPTCVNCNKPFAITAEDFDIYKRFSVPPPTWCPLCRFQRRIVFRTERKLFRTKSGLSGKDILALYPPDSPFPVYTEEEWHSDAWDPLSYGQEVDFSRPFLEQVRELDRKVPKSNKSVLAMVNSEYCANASYLKNCYLLFNSNTTEDSAYGNGVDRCRNCYDNSHLQDCERCYGSFWLTKCYRAYFSPRSRDCNDIWFSRNCIGCSNCVGCTNLRTKKYCIFNEQYSPEEYAAKVKEMRLDTWTGFSKVREQAEKFWLGFPNKYIQGLQNKDVSGAFIMHSKNVHESYLIREGEDMKYAQYCQVPPAKDCYDSSVFGDKAELFYETSVCGWGGMRLKFCHECWSGVQDLEYCMFCKFSSNLFGCVGVRNKQYCILNKQYGKEEYFALVEKIKKHMDDMPYVDAKGRMYRYGEFFPAEFSPITYNYSIAPEHFPLSKEDALDQGFRWQDANPSEYQATMKAVDIPDAIADVPESIVKEVIQCEACGKAYRLILTELQFLKQAGIPAPRTCVDCRHNARIRQRNRAIFYERGCDCGGLESGDRKYKNTGKHFHEEGACPNRFETSYAPDRPDIVYCGECYQAEVA